MADSQTFLCSNSPGMACHWGAISQNLFEADVLVGEHLEITLRKKTPLQQSQTETLMSLVDLELVPFGNDSELPISKHYNEQLPTLHTGQTELLY